MPLTILRLTAIFYELFVHLTSRCVNAHHTLSIIGSGHFILQILPRTYIPHKLTLGSNYWACTL